jgi:hypothetical protein
MARIINGQKADTPEEKRKAVESAGGKYTQNLEGDLVEIKSNSSKEKKPNEGGYVDVEGDGNKTPGTGNYTENLGGEWKNRHNK